MMKKYIYKISVGNKPDLYFDSLKKVHSYAVFIGANISRNFAQFSRWMNSDGGYDLGNNGDMIFKIEVI